MGHTYQQYNSLLRQSSCVNKMIKIALKHWIYEKCIDVLFKAIDNNFCFGPEKNGFKVGDKFKYIYILSKDPLLTLSPSGRCTLYDCTILNNDRGRLTVEFYGKSYYSKSTDKMETDFYDKPHAWFIDITDINFYRVP